MSNVPVTYLLEYSQYPENVRRSILREFSVNGGKYVVLGDRMISQIVRKPEFAGVLQKELADEGLQFMDSHAPFGFELDMNNPDAFRIATLRHTLHLHIAAMLNVKTMTIHIGNKCHFPDVSVDEQIDRICGMISRLLPVAEELDVTVCIENIWTQINTPEKLLQIKSHFPSDHLGFCLDAGHANIMDNGRLYPEGVARNYWMRDNSGEPCWDENIAEKMLPYVVNCHLHDNYGDRDQHQLPGKGNINWQKLQTLLDQAPRLQVIQCETLAIRNSLAIKEMTATFKAMFNN